MNYRKTRVVDLTMFSLGYELVKYSEPKRTLTGIKTRRIFSARGLIRTFSARKRICIACIGFLYMIVAEIADSSLYRLPRAATTLQLDIGLLHHLEALVCHLCTVLTVTGMTVSFTSTQLNASMVGVELAFGNRT
jgi:hypothetical protein